LGHCYQWPNLSPGRGRAAFGCRYETARLLCRELDASDTNMEPPTSVFKHPEFLVWQAKNAGRERFEFVIGSRFVFGAAQIVISLTIWSTKNSGSPSEFGIPDVLMLRQQSPADSIWVSRQRTVVPPALEQDTFLAPERHRRLTIPESLRSRISGPALE
jgi:hypothetical protein